MYHAEVKLIKTVKPVEVEGRAPWPKLKIRGSFELAHASNVDAPVAVRETKSQTHYRMVAEGRCVDCFYPKDTDKVRCSICLNTQAMRRKAIHAGKVAMSRVKL